MTKRFSPYPTYHAPSTDDFELQVQSDPHLGRSFGAMRVWQMHRGKWARTLIYDPAIRENPNALARLIFVIVPH